jgi:hypothetical protein
MGVNIRPSPLKALVCGGRHYGMVPDPMYTPDKGAILDMANFELRRDERQFMIAKLDEIDPDIIINGAAFGADLIARDWAISRRRGCWTFPADWDRYGKAAGPIRNKQMLEWGRPDIVIAFPGGKGTRGMIALARAAGVPVGEYSPAQNSCDGGK